VGADLNSEIQVRLAAGHLLQALGGQPSGLPARRIIPRMYGIVGNMWDRRRMTRNHARTMMDGGM
jgi:hypothetical protein